MAEEENNEDDKSKTVATASGSATVSVGSSQTAIGIPGVVSAHKERKNQIIQQVPDSGEIDSDLKEDIRSFFLWGYGVIELYSAHLIRVHIIDDRYERKTWNYFKGGSGPTMSQFNRQVLLQQAGIFDGIQGRIDDLKNTRNDLAHEPFKPIQWREQNIAEEMEELVDIIDTLYAALTDEDLKEDLRAGHGLE